MGQSANNKGYGVRGSIESWQQEIANNVAGNPFMMLGVAVALSAPIIHLINAESFGVHIFGVAQQAKQPSPILQVLSMVILMKSV